jgi:hypothetical protein
MTPVIIAYRSVIIVPQFANVQQFFFELKLHPRCKVASATVPVREGPKLCSVVTIICICDTTSIISLIKKILHIITKQEFAILPGIH